MPRIGIHDDDEARNRVARGGEVEVSGNIEGSYKVRSHHSIATSTSISYTRLSMIL